MINFVFGGGLGNQMFQYAFLYANLNTKTTVRAIMHRNLDEDHRNFSLDVFDHTIQLEVVDEMDAGCRYKGYVLIKKILYRIFRKLKMTQNEMIAMFYRCNIIYSTSIYDYYPETKLKKNCYIEGAFQNWRYFSNCQKEIRKEFTFKHILSIENENILQLIKNSNSVCVHIRRGDYINHHYAKALHICDNAYYTTAMNLINENIENPEFFIFTGTHEDHIWIHRNYNLKGSIHHVDLNNPDYVELYLMSQCKHFIIANSTFSWWAQYLSENEDKLVVAPSKWYRGRQEAQGLYMPGWKLVNVE